MKDMPVFLLYLLQNQYYNKMKKKSVLPLFFAGIFLIACSGHASKQKNKDPEPIQTEKQKTDAPNLKDSLKIKDGLGDIVEQRYEGILPAASGPGIKYDLTICSQENSGDGVFMLNMTYLEAENGKDETFTTTGKRLTLRGSAMNNDDTVYELVPSDGSGSTYFLVQGDSLTLLNSELKKAESNLNYTIVLVK